jgi:PIN domain nuclease of toxin-antitoxin system
MTLLLDANIAVWWLSNRRRLRPQVVETIARSRCMFSTASLLELTTKAAAGRLVFDQSMKADLATLCDWLPVTAPHALLVQDLPRIHNDPFDRVIVAQAMIEGLTLVTGDHILADYGVSVLLT